MSRGLVLATCALLLHVVASSGKDPLCVIPENMTDPQTIEINTHEPSGGEICKIDGLVQYQQFRCELRYCCETNCSCENIRSLRKEISTCGTFNATSEPEVLNCYLEDVKSRDYQKVCCNGFAVDDKNFCIEERNCSVDNGGCEGVCIPVGQTAKCQCEDGQELYNETKCRGPLNVTPDESGQNEPPQNVTPGESIQEQPDSTPTYIYILAGIAALILCLLFLLLLVLLMRRRKKKAQDHPLTQLQVNADAYNNNIYGEMPAQPPEPRGAVGGGDYEELPPKKKGDLGMEAEPLPDKIPIDGDDHYEFLQSQKGDKKKLTDQLGEEYGAEGAINEGFYENSKAG